MLVAAFVLERRSSRAAVTVAPLPVPDFGLAAAILGLSRDGAALSDASGRLLSANAPYRERFGDAPARSGRRRTTRHARRWPTFAPRPGATVRRRATARACAIDRRRCGSSGSARAATCCCGGSSAASPTCSASWSSASPGWRASCSRAAACLPRRSIRDGRIVAANRLFVERAIGRRRRRPAAAFRRPGRGTRRHAAPGQRGRERAADARWSMFRSMPTRATARG